MKKVFLVLSMIAMSVNSFAQEVEAKEELKGEVSESLASVRLANDLLRYGYTNKSTLALIDALQIFSENPTQPLKTERQGDAVDTSKTEGKKAQVAFDYETVLADAKKFADVPCNVDGMDVDGLVDLVKKENIDGVLVGVAEALIPS